MHAHDARRQALLARIAVAALLVLVAFACGSDKKKVVTPVSDTLTVRQGTWHRIRTYSVTGADSCQAAFPDTTDVVLCAFDPGAGNDPIGLICDIEQEGTEITVTCEGTLDLFPCRLDYHFAGSGTVTDTTLDITMRRWITVDAREEGRTICDSLYADPCTTTVVTKATWSVADTADVCPDTTSAPSVREFLNLMLGDRHVD